MLAILFRTLLIYLVLIFVMRVMGKRQIGELEITDLVTTLLISEIASIPISDHSIPVSHALIPMITVLVLEVLSSVVLVRLPRLKTLVSARPTVLIRNGELDQSALLSVRISMDELISEIRQQGYTDPCQISDAILEKNGKLTVLPKAEYATPTVRQLGLHVANEPMMHILLYNGTVNDTGLSLIGKDRAWLLQQLASKKAHAKDLFCVMANGEDRFVIFRKQGKDGKSK